MDPSQDGFHVADSVDRVSRELAKISNTLTRIARLLDDRFSGTEQDIAEFRK